MIFQLQLTPLTLLLPLALLLGLIAWLATRNHYGGIGDAFYVLTIWAGAVFVWLVAAVVVLSLHLFFHFA